jgi:hypothetical protein
MTCRSLRFPCLGKLTHQYGIEVVTEHGGLAATLLVLLRAAVTIN